MKCLYCNNKLQKDNLTFNMVFLYCDCLILNDMKENSIVFIFTKNKNIRLKEFNFYNKQYWMHYNFVENQCEIFNGVDKDDHFYKTFENPPKFQYNLEYLENVMKLLLTFS